MFGDLRNTPSQTLLEFVQIILSKPDAEVSAFDHTELDQINDEFIRRDGVNYRLL